MARSAEMEFLAKTLGDSIEQRRLALEARISELRGTVPDERSALARVLELFAFFPYALQCVVDAELQRNASSDSRVQLLRPLLRHVTEVATFIEEWLSHTGAPVVPLYLLDAVRRSTEGMGLEDRQAVIATGPADDFTTVVASIEEILFPPLGPLCPEVPANLSGNFALMRAPRLEGSVARWHPILLGHELAHLAIGAHDSLARLDLQRGFDLKSATAIAVPGMDGIGQAGALRLLEIGERWAEELICDAFAVHMFGAGGVAALAEFLEIIGATDLLSDTHPPGRLRVQLLVEWLGEVANPRLEAIVAPWRELAAEPIDYPEEWAKFLISTLSTRKGDIRRIAQSWCVGYDQDRRASIIEEAAEALRNGIPPETTVVTDGVRYQLVEADVVAAGWIGRVEQFAPPTDRLCEKSLTNLEFMTRWGASGGAWPVPLTSGEKAPNEGSTLSADQLVRRLYAPLSERLVVTPLLPDFAAGASLDLRLGNSFIVFVRSRTAFFDPLAEAHDPRQMQRTIHLAWGDTFVLHPAELVLAATLEYLVLPGDLSAQVVSRSSYGRLGLLSATAVQVHPHFHGCLTLELVNLGTVPLVLRPGERIAQLVVSPTAAAPAPLPSKYHCPIGPEFSKARTDAEAEVLRKLR